MFVPLRTRRLTVCLTITSSHQWRFIGKLGAPSHATISPQSTLGFSFWYLNHIIGSLIGIPNAGNAVDMPLCQGNHRTRSRYGSLNVFACQKNSHVDPFLTRLLGSWPIMQPGRWLWTRKMPAGLAHPDAALSCWSLQLFFVNSTRKTEGLVWQLERTRAWIFLIKIKTNEKSRWSIFSKF